MEIRFVASPIGLANVPLLILAPSLAPNLVGWHTNVSQMFDPFKGITFKHEGTKVYNLKSPLGMKKYFKKNSPQLLFFFAQLLIKFNSDGKRVLLISKEAFIPLCIEKLNQYLGHFGSSLRVVKIPKKGEEELLESPNTVPIIHYGIEGINQFEEYDAAFCLNSYNGKTDVLSHHLQQYFPLDIEHSWKRTSDGEHVARVTGFGRFQRPEVESLAASVGKYYETTVVEQAIGRVRPFTRPRIIITQQRSRLALPYDEEFTSLQAMRKFFDVPSMRKIRSSKTQQRVRDARRRGLTQKQVAAETGLSVRTVKRCDRREK